MQCQSTCTGKDDRTSLLSENHRSSYGTTGTTASSSQDEDVSRGSSDVEGGSQARRRRKRRLRRHQKSRTLLVNHLATMIGNGEGSEEDENEDHDQDLVSPALDPSAQEVIASLPSLSREHLFSKRSTLNLSTVRAKYRAGRISARDGRNDVLTMMERFKLFVQNDSFFKTLRRILVSKQNIIIFVNIDLIVDLLLCGIYLIEMKQEADVDLSPPWLFKWRSHDIWVLCQMLSLWNFLSFAIRIFLNLYPSSVLFSFRCFIEMITTVPFLLSSFIPHGEYLYVPYFLRSWVLSLRVKSVMKIKTNLQLSSAMNAVMDPFKPKLVHLVCTLVVLVYNGTTAFQYCEATFGGKNYSILDSLYIVMVTLSTVGYGDFVPSTESSRLVIILLIIISLAVIPGLIADTLNTYRKRKDGGGSVSKGTIPFILIVGTFRPKHANDILNGFLNRENGESHLNVVFLDINEPTEELKLMERNSMWGHRVQFLHGSVLNEETLERVRARSAKAIFSISDQYTPDPTKEDERNTVRLWSLYCYTVPHNVPIYSYNLSPTTAIYQKMAQEIICIRELKQYLLAMNCRCRGASTLLTNLLHQRQPLNRYDEPWQAQYDDGSCNEIYMAPPVPCLVGQKYGYVAWLLYKECQVILFAVKIAMDNQQYEILLNPDNAYEIQPTDLCVYMAESPREIRDISKLSPSYVWHAIESVKNRRAPPESMQKEQRKMFRGGSSASGSSTHHHTVFASSPKQLDRPPQMFSIARLPSTRHAMLTGSRSLIAGLGSVQPDAAGDGEQDVDENSASLLHCYLLKVPASLDDMVIKSTEDMEGHILVCLHHRFSNLFKFIYNQRSPFLRRDELQDIVFLCMSLPETKLFELIHLFPKVYFMVGNCRHPDDLLRAGVLRAKQVVVMSERECLDQYERSSDSPAIMTSHLMDVLMQNNNKRPDAFRIVNLEDESNIRFMHLLQGKDVEEEVEAFYSPTYAAGDVMVDSLISNVLLSQTYFKPDIVSVFRALIGMPHPVFTANVQRAPHVTLIQLPDSFTGKTFAYMFETLLLDYDILPMGLLRAPDEMFGNELPFVYTNPVPSLILKPTDQVYVLSPP